MLFYSLNKKKIINYIKYNPLNSVAMMLFVPFVFFSWTTAIDLQMISSENHFKFFKKCNEFWKSLVLTSTIYHNLFLIPSFIDSLSDIRFTLDHIFQINDQGERKFNPFHLKISLKQLQDNIDTISPSNAKIILKKYFFSKTSLEENESRTQEQESDRHTESSGILHSQSTISLTIGNNDNMDYHPLPQESHHILNIQ